MTSAGTRHVVTPHTADQQTPHGGPAFLSPTRTSRMPEAVATTKRKFYHALDSLTASSRSSHIPASLTGAKQTGTAAQAFDEARERARKRLRQSTPNVSLESLPLKVRSSNDTLNENSRSREPPNYSPWSHDAFLARLKTFSSVSLWHPKPEAVGEVEWAKRGWRCVGVNTVACKGGCGQRAVVDLRITRRPGAAEDDESAAGAERIGENGGDDKSEDETQLEQALVERYRTVIVDGHSENCLWRRAGCKDDIYRLQVVRPSVWQPELRTRYQSIASMAHKVEQIQLDGTESTDEAAATSRTLSQTLPASLLGHSTTELGDAERSKVLCIALHGWRGSTESGSELLNCDACFQRIGLWMYQPDYKPAVRLDNDDENNSRLTLDLVQLHREHCPWRNPATQMASGSLAGLNAVQILYRICATYAREQKRQSNRQAISLDDLSEKDGATEGASSTSPKQSKEEIARLDKERESKLRKLKSLFNIKKRISKPTTSTMPA